MNAAILALRAIANGEVPKTDISKLLYKHKCLFLLSKASGNEFEQKLPVILALNSLYVQERLQACEPLFRAFKEHNIRYAVIKGPVLSKAAYGDVCYRSSADIDLLINRGDIDKVKDITLKSGFVQGRIVDRKIVPFTRQELIFQSSMSHQTAPFIKQTKNPICQFVNLDINMDIIWGESKEKPDMNYVLEELEHAELSSIEFTKLKPEMEFISLCLHHYKDMNSLYMLYSNKLNLSLFSDIYFYIKNQRPNTDKLLKTSLRLGVTKYLYYCIFYAQLLFDSPLLNEYLQHFHSYEAIKLLDAYGLDERERKVWQIGFFDRLLIGDMRSYLDLHLDDFDKKKIALNSQLM